MNGYALHEGNNSAYCGPDDEVKLDRAVRRRQTLSMASPDLIMDYPRHPVQVQLEPACPMGVPKVAVLSNSSSSTTTTNRTKYSARKKSHPWRTDVLLKRGGGGGCATQLARTAWKQMMSERKSVYNSVVLLEGTHGDDDDGTTAGEASSNGCINGSFDSGEVSVGTLTTPPPAPSDVEKQNQKQQQLEEDYKASLKRLEDRLRTVTSGSARVNSTTVTPQGIAEDENEGEEDEQVFDDDASLCRRRQRVVGHLGERLLYLYTGDHQTVEAVGRGGIGASPMLNQDYELYRQQMDAVLRELHEDVFPYWGFFVGDDEDDADNKSSSADPAATVATLDSTTTNGNHKVVDLREQVNHSLSAFEAALEARGVVVTDDESCWTECTVEESVAAGNMQQKYHNGGDDDEWTEYTVEDSVRGAAVLPARQQHQTSVVSSGFRVYPATSTAATTTARARMGPANKPDDDEWTEYTIPESVRGGTAVALAEPVAPPASPDRRKLDTSPTRGTGSNSSSGGDDYYDCYDATPTASFDEPRTDANNRQQQAHRTHDDDDCYTEVTIEETVVGKAAPVAIALSNRERFLQMIGNNSDDLSEDGQSYMECTVNETVVDEVSENRGGTSAPVNAMTTRQEQGEERVEASGGAAETTTRSELLSSRMFSDIVLTAVCGQQALQQEQGEYRDVSIPEEVAPARFDDDDDDMTQITFDQTYADDFAVENSFTITLNKSPLNTKAPGGFDSQTTEDTTVTNGSTSSSTNEGNSLSKSRASASSARVAELLRRDMWSKDAAVVQAAMEELSKQAAQGSQQRFNIVRFGGLLAVLRALEVHVNLVGIVMAACVTLENLALDRDTVLAIGQVGGIQAIAGAMKEHVDHDGVQQAACSALAKITACCDRCEVDFPVPADGAVKAMVIAMTRHASNGKIQADAFGALTSLCLDDRERVKELSQEGGFSAMTMALQKPWENHSAKHEAISTLSILLRSLADGDQ